MDKLGERASNPCHAQLRLRGARGGRGRAASGTVGSRRDFGPPGALERRERLAPAAMEDEKSFSDICGGRVVLRRRYYSPYCREFGLSSARLSLRSLTAVTCAVWLAAYGLFTLCEVKAGARPSQAAAVKRADPWARAGVWGLWARDAVPRLEMFSLSGWLSCSSPERTSSESTVSGCSSPMHASLPVIARGPQNSRKGLWQTQLCTCVCRRSALFLPDLCVSRPCQPPPPPNPSPI